MEKLKRGGKAGLGRLCLYMLSLGFENLSEEAKTLEYLKYEAYVGAKRKSLDCCDVNLFKRKLFKAKKKRD